MRVAVSEVCIFISFVPLAAVAARKSLSLGFAIENRIHINAKGCLF